MILGIGIDIIEVARIEKAVERWGEMFLEHVYTKEEIVWAQKHKFPFPHYAGRFAAKEAIFKALENPDATWKDFNIINDAQGKPHCSYNNKKFKDKILLTIAHTKEYAVAHAIITT